LHGTQFTFNVTINRQELDAFKLVRYRQTGNFDNVGNIDNNRSRYILKQITCENWR